MRKRWLLSATLCLGLVSLADFVSVSAQELRKTDGIEFTDVRKNQTLRDEILRPDFPKGALVTDHVRELAYVVGEPFEEQEAIRRFMHEHRLAAPPEQQRRWAWWWWVGGIGLLVILLGLLLAWRWHWLRRHFFDTSTRTTT